MPDQRSRCPACQDLKSRLHYMCRRCWRQLPHATRAALWLRDEHALARLQELRRKISAGIPLNQITIERRFEGGGDD